MKTITLPGTTIEDAIQFEKDAFENVKARFGEEAANRINRPRSRYALFRFLAEKALVAGLEEEGRRYRHIEETTMGPNELVLSVWGEKSGTRHFIEPLIARKGDGVLFYPLRRAKTTRNGRSETVESIQCGSISVFVGVRFGTDDPTDGQPVEVELNGYITAKALRELPPKTREGRKRSYVQLPIVNLESISKFFRSIEAA